MKKEMFVLKTTVRETAKDDKLAMKVIAQLRKVEKQKVSKAEAYRRAMQTLAFQLGI